MILTNSNINSAETVALVELSDTPDWLRLLDQDPFGFPKRSAIGTIWRFVDTVAIDEQGQTELIRAIITQSRNTPYITMLAEFETTDANVQDQQGRTALHWACAQDDPELVRLCLSMPTCEIGLSDKDNCTPFDITHGAKNEVIMDLLLNDSRHIDPTQGVISHVGETLTVDPELANFKFETTFYTNGVLQIASCTELTTGPQNMRIQVKWNDRVTLGHGGFGTVILQEAETGELRAVKKIHKVRGKMDYSRELRVMLKVADVSLTQKAIRFHRGK